MLQHTNRNGESYIRDYLSWSEQLQALFCFPCRLFSTSESVAKSLLASPGGWSADSGPKWKKLYERLSEHESSISHRQCYLSWRDIERILRDVVLERKILKNRDHWRRILKRLLHVVFFLSERGLPFRGNSCKIGDKHNGLFLGIIEVIACYDSTLKGHLEKVRLSQEDNKRQQVHYLSPQSQNEFIKECSEKVLTKIKLEISNAKYYSIILDSTPDASHKEQTTFILRYVSAFHRTADTVRVYDIQERFMTFMDFSQKKGEDSQNGIEAVERLEHSLHVLQRSGLRQ